MQKNMKSGSVRVMKFIFTLVAVISFVFVFYNIGIYTNDQDLTVFAELN